MFEARCNNNSLLLNNECCTCRNIFREAGQWIGSHDMISKLEAVLLSCWRKHEDGSQFGRIFCLPEVLSSRPKCNQDWRQEIGHLRWLVSSGLFVRPSLHCPRLNRINVVNLCILSTQRAVHRCMKSSNVLFNASSGEIDQWRSAACTVAWQQSVIDCSHHFAIDHLQGDVLNAGYTNRSSTFIATWMQFSWRRKENVILKLI